MQNLLPNLLFIFAFDHYMFIKITNLMHMHSNKTLFEGQQTILSKNIIQLRNHFPRLVGGKCFYLVERNRRRNMRKEDGDEEKVKEEEEGVGGR